MSPRPLLRLLVVADCAAWWIGVAALTATAASRSAAGTGATTTTTTTTTATTAAGTAAGACSRIGAAALITPTAAAGATRHRVSQPRCLGVVKMGD